MPRQANKLTAIEVQKTSKPGLHGDGHGLWLQVSKYGTKSWLFRYALNKRRREMGLGPYPGISLAKARKKAEDARELLREHIDPIEARNRARADQSNSSIPTFSACAEAYIESHKAGWRNAKHAAQWQSSLKKHANPVIGEMPVSDITTHDVLKVLEPIWQTRTETASRVRGRIESILDWAKVRGYRSGENPALWRGHLDKQLPKRSKVAPVRHHPALPYTQTVAFMKKLRAVESVSARALEFLILTATRTTEVLNATWNEVDLEQAIWVIPASRIKAGREHRVPLSNRSVEILDGMAEIRQNQYLFPGFKQGKTLSVLALSDVIRRALKIEEITVHGFRSTFRDWTAECTNYPREVAEAALAHRVQDQVEAAYRRGDLFNKRRMLMDDWCEYCCTP